MTAPKIEIEQVQTQPHAEEKPIDNVGWNFEVRFDGVSFAVSDKTYFIICDPT